VIWLEHAPHCGYAGLLTGEVHICWPCLGCARPCRSPERASRGVDGLVYVLRAKEFLEGEGYRDQDGERYEGCENSGDYTKDADAAFECLYFNVSLHHLPLVLIDIGLRTSSTLITSSR
jgi:hypothetical protein